MPLLTVESTINDIARIGQRRRKLPVQIGIVLNNKKAHRELRSEAANQRALYGIDGQPAHFAIAGQDCQHIDQTIARTAKPRPHHRAGHTTSRDPHGGIKADHTACLALGPALFLIKAAQGFRAGSCWAHGVFPMRGGKRAKHQYRESESQNTPHGTTLCARY
jgi:hypothetical protein